MATVATKIPEELCLKKAELELERPPFLAVQAENSDSESIDDEDEDDNSSCQSDSETSSAESSCSDEEKEISDGESNEEEEEEEEEESPTGRFLNGKKKCCHLEAHPKNQPRRTLCTKKGKGFRNVFERQGKYLRSEIIVQRNIVHELANEAANVLPKSAHNQKNYLVTDQIVDQHYGEVVMKGFRDAGMKVAKIVVSSASMDDSGEPSTEPFKNQETFHKCVNEILASGISKHSCIISLGGAVVNNLCGVIASMLYRGISLVHFATTTMSCLDGSLDFKQAFNHCCGKNLLGAYYPADTIVIDPTVLSTLTERHALNGISEALKHGLTQSLSLTETIVKPLRDQGKRALKDIDYLEDLCRHTIEYKVPTLTHYHESDFNEMVPQYAHPLGHAIEHLSWKSPHRPLLHGESIAIAFPITAHVSHILGKCSKEVVDQHYQYTLDAGLPAFVPETMDVEEIINAMRYDKHFVDGCATMGLIEEIGVMAKNGQDSFAFPVTLDIVRKALKQNIARRDLQAL